MSKEYTLSRKALNNLLKHLVDLEENKAKVMDEFFPLQTKRRSEFEDLFRNYIAGIEDMINNAKVADGADCNYPYVLVGSRVSVCDLCEQKAYEFRIVSPLEKEIDENDVSYLSPVGMSLLLKRIGEEVTIRTPGGLLNYRIEEIGMPFR